MGFKKKLAEYEKLTSLEKAIKTRLVKIVLNPFKYYNLRIKE